MQIDIDAKKELLKWGPINFKLIYGSLFIEAFLLFSPEKYGFTWPPSLSIIHQGKFTWVSALEGVRRVGLQYFQKYFLNQKNFKALYRKWEICQRECAQFMQRLLKINLAKLDQAKFFQLLEKFYKLNLEFWLIGMVPETVNLGVENYFHHELRRLYPEKADTYLEILLAPTWLSFFQQEEIALMAIGKLKTAREQKNALRQHAQKFYWLLNSYDGSQVLGVEFFQKKLKEFKENPEFSQKAKKITCIPQKIRKAKEKLVHKIKLPENLAQTAFLLDQSMAWQDVRKSYIWQLNHGWDLFMQEIASRSDWKFTELYWCWPQELLAILSGDAINRPEISQRKKYYATYSVGSGPLHKFTRPAFVQRMIKLYLNSKPQTETLRGLIVSKGPDRKIRGIVKMIDNPFTQASKMQEGDILVTTMTEPEFIVVMKKAKAIITDEGGMTSHAAIVSRELNIPCLVGTKHATQILSDGNYIEVDVKSGIVRILKK